VTQVTANCLISLGISIKAQANPLPNKYFTNYQGNVAMFLVRRRNVVFFTIKPALIASVLSAE
jgi:hypothetical protein